MRGGSLDGPPRFLLSTAGEEEIMNANLQRFHNDSDLKTIVDRFEQCEFNNDEFRHADHLTVALWYLANSPKPVAVDRMRCQLKKFTAYHKVNAYHETITLFWMEVVSNFLEDTDGSELLHQTADRLVTRFPTSKVIQDYYSKELLDSERAKAEWVEPDLRSMRAHPLA